MPTNYETARRVLPDKGAKNFPWRVDRALKAKKVPLSEWKDKTNRTDWNSYDTPDRRPLPDKRDLLKKKHRTPSSGEAALAEEPQRFLREGQESRRLLERIKDQFFDFESFKIAARKALADDRGGFDQLIADVDARGGNRGYEALFNTGVVKGWLKENTQGAAVSWLRNRFKVSESKARSIFNSYSDKRKEKVIEASFTGKRVRIRPTPQVVERGQRKPYIPPRPRIRQLSRTGTSYLRTKPQNFTELEKRFLRSQAPRMSLVRLLEQHQRTFLQTPRTLLSLKNKVQRLGLRSRRS